MGSSNAARQAEPQPPQTTKEPDQKRKNRFDGILGKATFKPLSRANDNRANKPFNDGTIQTSLATAVIALGTSGGYIRECRMVHRKYSNGKGEFLFLFPSLGGASAAFHRGVIDVSESEHAAKDLEEVKAGYVQDWMRWQRERVAAGEVTTGPTKTSGVNADADMMKDLGLSL